MVLVGFVGQQQKSCIFRLVRPLLFLDGQQQLGEDVDSNDTGSIVGICVNIGHPVQLPHGRLQPFLDAGTGGVEREAVEKEAVRDCLARGVLVDDFWCR